MVWQTGQSGNPSGRVRSKPFAETLNRALAQGSPERLRRIAEALLDKAADGDLAAIKEVADRLDGKTPQSLSIGNDDGQPFMLQRIERVIIDARNPADQDAPSVPAAT